MERQIMEERKKQYISVPLVIFFPHFEQEALHFYFAQNFKNSIASLVKKK